MADVDKFSPVAFDPRAYAAQRSATDPTFKLAFESLDDEFSALDVLLREPGWRRLTAVRTGRVQAVARGEFLIPGPRTVDGVEKLARWLQSVAGGS